MSSVKIPYLKVYKDRHGIERAYFRRKGQPETLLKGKVGSVEFSTAYEKAFAYSHETENMAKIPTGSVKDVIERYKRTPDFMQLAPETTRTYRNLLRRIEEGYGKELFRAFTPQVIRQIIAGFHDKPDVGNRILSMFTILSRCALEAGLISSMPTRDVRKLKTQTKGFYTWQETDIDVFEAAHSEDTRARLALHLLLYTAQRRSDIVEMGFKDIRDGMIYVQQSKTKNRLSIPIHPTLQAAIDKTAPASETFLTTKYGGKFEPASFTNWFRKCCKEAGLSDECSPHGLRKAAARRLAEAGCTVHQIMSITGHKTMSEVLTYTQAANQIGLAKEAVKAMKG
jgi:integrase